jgi:hypothetical protein
MFSLDPNTSLDDVIKSTLHDIQNLKNARILSQGYSTISNHPSYTMVYQAPGLVQPNEVSSPQDSVLETKLSFAVKDNAVYVVSFSTARDNFNEYLKLVQPIMNSFTLIEANAISSSIL